MADIQKLQENLTRRGFTVSRFRSAEQANAHLTEQLSGKTIGIGGSMTVKEMGLDTALEAAGASLIWHWNGGTPQQAAQAQAYISSVNGAAETGELINIDGFGNRVASTCFGHESLYLVFGVNKVEESFEKALWRARNIAAPKNAQRLGRKTPCALHGDRCYDCASPERICRAMTVLWAPPRSFQRVEVVIIEQSLGL